MGLYSRIIVCAVFVLCFIVFGNQDAFTQPTNEQGQTAVEIGEACRIENGGDNIISPQSSNETAENIQEDLQNDNEDGGGGGADSGGGGVTGTCPLMHTFPSDYYPSQFGDARSGGSRRHAGLDLFYMGKDQKVSIPEGCEVVLNSRGGFAFAEGGTSVDDASGNVVSPGPNSGYGYFMWLRCNQQSPKTITLRYAHLNCPIKTSSNLIVEGGSGTSGQGDQGHYHFEVIISNKGSSSGIPVDPECVMYGKKDVVNLDGGNSTCRSCPSILANQPANLCDPSHLNALIQHSRGCLGGSSGSSKAVPTGRSVPPSQLAGKTITNPSRLIDAGPNCSQDGEPTEGEDNDAENNPEPDNPHGDHEHGYEHTAQEGYQCDPNIIHPPAATDPPFEEPAPPTPGQPGDPANLIIPPQEPPEELSSCASDTWVSMVNRAAMQSRRESIMNRRYIVKNDSVLQYSCFNEALRAAGDGADPLFSGSDYSKNKDVPLLGFKGDDRKTTIKIYDKDKDQKPIEPEEIYRMQYLTNSTFDEALSLLVDDDYKRYRDLQYNHDYLAGSVPTGMTKGGVCAPMGYVWQAAKCKNFDDVNIFMTFDELINLGTDPRQFPEEIKCD